MAKPRAPAAGTHNAARIIGIVGATGMGKGATIKAEILPTLAGILNVWSPLEETDRYAPLLHVKPAASLDAVVAAWREGRSSVYVPPMNPKAMAGRFDLWCRMQWEMVGAAVLIEELSGVTTASWAPPAWKKLSTAGRHRGLMLIGTCQRPAQVDKDFFNGCTEIRCFRVNALNDAKVMANVLHVEPETILNLEKLTYIRRDMDARRNVLCQVGGGELGAIDRAGTVTQITADTPPRTKKAAGGRR